MDKKPTTHRFADYDIVVELAKYSNGRIAITSTLLSGEPFMIFTANLPDVELEDETKDVIIRNYAENTGALQFLIDDKIIHQPYKTHKKHFGLFEVEFPVCKLRDMYS